MPPLILDVDCLASSKTYERLMNRKPPDPVDEGYDSHEEVPSLGGDEEEEDIDNKEVDEHPIAKDQQRVEVKKKNHLILQTRIIQQFSPSP